MILKVRGEKLNVKKKGILLGLAILFNLFFINAPPASAAAITEYTVDSGQFNTWLHSDGKTWQNIPGFGVKKPGDTVTFNYTVQYDGGNLSKVKGVKTVYFYTGDKATYEKSPRIDWQSYKNYSEGNYHKFSVKSLTVKSFSYLGNGKVQIAITSKLDTIGREELYPEYPGEYMHEQFQGQLTQGRKFYTPTVIEWEIESTGHNLTVQIEGQGSTTPAGSKAPGTVHKNMSGNVALSAVPAAGWQFAQWVDVTAGIVQFSTTPNSSVSMNKDKTIRAVFIPASTPQPPGKQEYLTVVPSTYTLFEGEYKRFKAYHHKSDGTTVEVTNGSEWSVSNSSIARLSTSVKGELWGLKEGRVELKARYKGMEGTADVTVIPEPVPPPPNFKPVADFTISNPAPVEGELVRFWDESTHEGSRYGEQIVGWEWTFENAGGSTEQNSEAIWEEVGTYKVTLRVEDQDGDSDSCTKSVVVGPALPAAVITTSTDYIIIGREIHIDGDESTAAMGRSIKWDEMEWKFYNPDNTLAYEYTGRYPLGKGTANEKTLTNSVLNKTGNWRITLKVKDTNDNESEVTERIIRIYPDNPPIADFWLASEALRYSYDGYDLTVRDLSTPGDPDDSLGDEIYERTWTLHYDANNDGNAKGYGDEVIRPGDKGKAAEIIQASKNDPRPVIRFNKTGRYQLELTVKERYTAWGETVAGLAANTDSKAIANKQLIVINLSPTIAFDIKKKTPLDILFTADYTVSDSKYNNLNSSQAGFINELESGFIEPIVGVERVKVGDVGTLYEIPNIPAGTTVTDSGLNDVYNFTAVNKGSLFDDYTLLDAIDLSTGRIEKDKELQAITQLNDGNYITSSANRTTEEFIPGMFWGRKVFAGYEKRGAKGEIIQGTNVYNQAMNKAIPASYEETYGSNTIVWKSSIMNTYFNTDGSFFVIIKSDGSYKGETKTSFNKYYLSKINSDFSIAYTRSIWDKTTTNDVKLNVIRHWSNINQIGIETLETTYNTYNQKVLSIGDKGNFTLDSRSISQRGSSYSWKATSNGNYLICATRGEFRVYSYSSCVNITSVPLGLDAYHDNCILIDKWMPNKTIIAYMHVSWVNSSYVESLNAYILDENNAAITYHNIYDQLYPADIGIIGESGSWNVYTFVMRAQVVSPGLLGVNAYKRNSYQNYDIEYHYYSIIDQNMNVKFTSKQMEDSSRATGKRDNSYFQSVGSTIAAFHQVEQTRRDPARDSTYNSIVYFLNQTGQNVLNLNSREFAYGQEAEYARRVNNGFKDNTFYIVDNQTIYYSPSGVLKWQKPLTFGNIASPTMFKELIVFSSGSSTLLVNPANGQVLTTIPCTYLFNTEEYLLCRAANGTIIVYGQLQGLQYLKQAIDKHIWDNNNFNVVASVIDADSFKDFEAQKDNIKSLLQAKSLRLAVISPSTGTTKAQAEQIINQNPDGGWWIQTASTMPTSLSNLAKKIIQAVNEDRGADNIVLVGQAAELKANYHDMENDPADKMEWSFVHDNENLGSSLKLIKKSSISGLHNKKQTVILNGKNQNLFDITFDQAGTYKVYAKAQDRPITTDAYLEHEKAGKKWSSQDGYITVLAHRKPIANFTINSSSIHKNSTLNITDNSYDPDLYDAVTKATTDPLNQKGLRSWEWQYKKPDGAWEKHLTNDNVPPTIYTSSGTYQVRLRVKDVFGAWSDWTDAKAFNVVNRPPIANFTVEPNPAAVGIRSMIIDSSRDPDGDEIVEWKWEIAKGLGEVETIIRTSAAPFPYVWNMEGTFNVKLTVKDIEGATGTITKPVTVILNQPPVAVIKLPAEIFTDEWFTADGTSSYDPDGDTLTKAYWQYMKSGAADWSAVHTQMRSGPFNISGESFLRYPLYPRDGEHGTWKLRLIVEDSKGLISLPAEVTFTVTEGWEIIGNIVPEIGERNRKMIVSAYAHRKGKPDEKYMIDSMKAEIAYMDYECTIKGRAVAEGMETLNMPYDSAKADFRVTYLIKDKIYETNRWPVDGRYYIKVIGQKGSTTKEIVLPFSIKGNLYQRIYIRTYSW